MTTRRPTTKVSPKKPARHTAGAPPQAKALPAFLPPELSQTKPKFPWRGGLAHIGPTHTANALYKKLAGKAHGGNTQTAVLALEAGVLAWGAFAFAGTHDVGAHADLAELLFFAMDPSHMKDIAWDALDAVVVPERPKEEAALGILFKLARACLTPARWLDTQATPVQELFHSVYLVRHVLTPPMRRRFDRWLDDATRRIPPRAATKGFAPRTLNLARDRTWGHPLPMAILATDRKPSALATDRAKHVYAANRFIAPVTTYLARLTTAEKVALRKLGVRKLADLRKITIQAIGYDEALGWNVAAILATELGAAGLAFAEPEATAAAPPARDLRRKR